MADGIKLLFLYKVNHMIFGGIIEPGDEDANEDEDEVRELSKKLYNEHQEIFKNPKAENVGFVDSDFFIKDLRMANEHFLAARILKHGFSLGDAPVAILSDQDGFIHQNKTFFAFIEITYNGELDDGFFDDIASDLQSSAPFTLKVGGHEFLTLGDQPDYYIFANLFEDKHWEELGFSAEYEPEMKEFLERIRIELNEGDDPDYHVQWK
jgi:hypothetical protein